MRKKIWTITMVETLTFWQSVDSCSLARAGTLENLSLSRARPNPVSKGSVLGGPVSTSDKTSCCEISWSLKAARLVVWIIASLWNLTGSMSCLSNFKRSDNSEPGGGGGGFSEKFWRGCAGQVFRNHTLGYGDRGPKSYHWLWKMGQNHTLNNRKYHQINHSWSNFAPNWSNIRLEGPEDRHLRNSSFGGHVTSLTLQYLWPRPPGIWLGGPGCKPGHSGGS